jgi:hypothetical protein
MSEQKAFEEIEKMNETWKSEWMKRQSIWDYITMQINSYTGEKQNFWIRVMDLFKLKYG